MFFAKGRDEEEIQSEAPCKMSGLEAILPRRGSINLEAQPPKLSTQAYHRELQFEKHERNDKKTQDSNPGAHSS